MANHPVDAPARVAARRRWPYAVAALAGAGLAAVLVLRLGGGGEAAPVPGIPVRDTTVVWLVSLARVATDVLAVVTVGCLLAAGFFTAGDGRLVSTHGYRWLRAGGVVAAVWSLVAFAAIPIALSDILATSMAEAVTLRAVANFVTSVPQGTALLTVAALAAVVAVGCRTTLTVTGAATLTGLAILALFPPVLTSHVYSAGDHQQAVNSQLFHVVGAALWAGGLVALLFARRLSTPALATAARRYSQLALVCFIAVAGSGAFNTWIRFTAPGQLFTDAYGRVVLVKITALVALFGFGWWHRRRTLPRLAAGHRGLFLRYAGAEVVVFAATVGVAAGLSRTPPPPGDIPSSSLTKALLGFDMPGPLTWRPLLLDWYPDPLFLTLAGAAVAGYLVGLRRLARRGQAWPLARTAAWLAGWLLVAVATSSSLARYGPVLVSVHTVQHLTLAVLAPVPLALAAPLTLARQAMRPSATPGLRGPLEWLELAAGSRLLRAAGRPAAAVLLYAAALYPMYLPALYELTLRSHAAHLVAFGFFLAAGYLFFWQTIGADPPPRPLTRGAKAALLAVIAAAHAGFGWALIGADTPPAPGWFASLDRDWGPDLLTDQQLAGTILLLGGEAVFLGMLLYLAVSARMSSRRFTPQPEDRLPAHR
ncbi:MAG: copper resistance protein CopD [Micromonosporaceae bacterium]|nr:copper resistance protein CopD [Micromonosporaceae bacterium]